MKLLQKRVAGSLSAVAVGAMLAAFAHTASAQASLGRNPLKQPLSIPSDDAQTYFDFPIQRLKSAVPALRGIRYDPSQEQLPRILSRVANKIADVLPRLPDLISREDVFHFQSASDAPGPDRMGAGQPWSRQFKYLL